MSINELERRVSTIERRHPEGGPTESQRRARAMSDAEILNGTKKILKITPQTLIEIPGAGMVPFGSLCLEDQKRELLRRVRDVLQDQGVKV